MPNDKQRKRTNNDQQQTPNNNKQRVKNVRDTQGRQFENTFESTFGKKSNNASVQASNIRKHFKTHSGQKSYKYEQ